MDKANIAIIGGGPSGLIALYECKIRNIKASLYERESNLGGVWNLQSSKIRAHQSTIMNTSTFLTSFNVEFSFYKFMENKYEKENIDYGSSSDYNEYLHEFVKYYKLSNMILYNKDVIDVTVSKNGDPFRIVINDLKTGQREYYDHNYVIVASGRFGNPIIPQEPFLSEELKINNGKIWHSGDWDPLNKTSRSWNTMEKESLNILVIGSGQSAGEVIFDTINRAKKDGNYERLRIYWSPTRNPEKRNVWLIDHYPYKNLNIYLTADAISCRAFMIAPQWLAARELMKVCNCISRKGENVILNLNDDRICLCKRYLMEKAFEDKVLKVLQDPISRIYPSHVNQITFDTSTTKSISVDAVVIGSGYTYSEPKINGEYILNTSPFYKFIVPTDEVYQNRLGFICSTTIFGSSIPISQIETWWLFSYWFNECNDLKKKVKESKVIEKRSDIKRIPGYVMDELARDIKIMPKIWKNLFSLSNHNRHFALACLFGPWSIYQYPVFNETGEWRLKREKIMLSETEKTFRRRRKNFRVFCVIGDVIFYLNICGIASLICFHYRSLLDKWL